METSLVVLGLVWALPALPVPLPSGTPYQSDPESMLAAEEEEKLLENFVVHLRDMVIKIPTQGLKSTTKPPMVIMSVVESSPSPSPSPSKKADSLWVTVKSATNKGLIEVLGTVALTKKINPSAATAFWKLGKDKDAPVILHSVTTGMDVLPSEFVLSPTRSAYALDNTYSESLPLVMTTEEEIRSGTLANQLATGGDLHQLTGAGILTLIEKLIRTIKNAPHSVLEDPALHKKVEIAENFLKNALELAAEAEKKLKQQLLEGSIPSTTAQTEMVVLLTPSDSSLEPQTQVVEIQPTISTPALPTKVEIAVASTSSAISPEPETQVVIEAVSTPSASSHEPQTEVVLEISSEPSTSSSEPQAHVEVEVVSTPSATSHQSQTQVVIEAVSTPSTSSSTEVLLDISSEPSTSSSGPQTQVIEVVSAGSREPQTEVVLEVLSEPATSSQEPEGDVVLEIHSTQTSLSETEETIILTPAPSVTQVKTVQDIVDSIMVVVDTIKNVFCGNKERASKKILKQLLENHMELVKQAIKEERVS